MKKISFVCLLSFVLTGGSLSAQTGDNILPAKQVIEKAATGDIILGKEYKQKQLYINPALIQSASLNLKKDDGVNSKKEN
jgi:hypothetical protein